MTKTEARIFNLKIRILNFIIKNNDIDSYMPLISGKYLNTWRYLNEA